MKFFITSLLMLFFFELNANHFTIKSMGTLERNEVMSFPSGGKFIAFKHAGGFETDNGKYGKYECNGSILYNKKSTLENMYFACRFEDQIGDAFITMGKRLKGSDLDRAVGQFKLIDGKGFWSGFLEFNCSYAVEYVDHIVFAPAKCKK